MGIDVSLYQPQRPRYRIDHRARPRSSDGHRNVCREPLGAAMPIVLDIVGVDPAVASGPLVSTINDSLALAVYFSVVTGMLVTIG